MNYLKNTLVYKEQSWTVQALQQSLQHKDFGLMGHSVRLLPMIREMGKILNFSDSYMTELNLFAQFHDLGKILIPDEILFKQGTLTLAEWEEIQTHCLIGSRIASSVKELKYISDFIYVHHERWDGTGYPLGVSGRDIPLFCRILSVLDAYDAMTSDRPYRKALSRETALRELQDNAGTQFDPELVDIVNKNRKRIFLNGK